MREVTRRMFAVLFPSFAFLPLVVAGQSTAPDVRDGERWNSASESIKLGYVLGFTDAAAWAYGNVVGALSELKSLSSKDRAVLAGGKDVWDYNGIRLRQMISGLDTFYRDYRNAAIRWDRALSYVRDTVRGEPQDYLDRELELERKLALSQAKQD